MKKSTWLLSAILVALLSFFFIPRGGTKEYSQEKPALSKELVRLRLTKGPQQLEVFKDQAGEWRVREQGKETYPAAEDTVKEMIELLSKKRSLELVSENPASYPRYGLGENKILVSGYDAAEQPLRVVSVGNSGASFSSTFILWEQDPNVYQTADSLKNNFDLNLNDLRDKTVLSFKSDAVEGLRLEKLGRQVALKKQLPAGASNAQRFVWQDKTGEEYLEAEVNELVNVLSSLQADTFPESSQAEVILAEAEQNFESRFQVRLKTGRTHTLTLTKKNENGNYWVFSEAQVVAEIPSYNGDKLAFKWEALR